MSDEKRENKPFDVNKNDRPFRKDGDKPFRKDGDRPFRRDGDKPFRKDGDRPFRKDGDKPFRKDGDKSFRKDGERPFRKDGDKPFRKDGDKSFRKDGDRPFRKDGDKPFCKDGERPFRKDGDKPFRKENRPSAPKMGDPRRVALNALCDVMMADAYAGIALNKRFKEVELSPEDKRLATNIFYTALENRMRIDHLLNQLVASMPEPIVRAVLHVAAAQLLYMDRIPDHAAVDEAVNTIKRLGREHYAALVNGTLRNLIRERDAGELKDPVRGENPARYLSIMHSIPETLVSRLIAAYGEEEAEKIVSYKPEQHWENVRPNLMEMDDAAFEKYMTEKGWTWEKGIAAHSYRLLRAGDLAGDEDFRKGLFSIQGESSMLAAQAVCAKAGMNIIDACAAPGGKSALMCEIMQGTGRVYAYELHEHRVELLKGMANRLKLYNLRPAQADATVFRPENADRMNAVLVDAPCSGLGVMGDKPDLKYRMKDENLVSITETQKKLLDTCSKYVQPGGLLVYSTCTLLPEENQNQVREFLNAHPEFSLETDVSWLPESLREYAEDGMIQLLPHRHEGMDGFFIARMRRAR